MQRTTIYWIAGIGTLAALLWLLRGILAPFVFGAIIAYFLDPVADWFEKKGLKRLPSRLWFGNLSRFCALRRRCWKTCAAVCPRFL